MEPPKKHVMKAALKNGVKNGTLIQVKASYKLSPEAKKKSAAKKKPAAKKAAPKKKVSGHVWCFVALVLLVYFLTFVHLPTPGTARECRRLPRRR